MNWLSSGLLAIAVALASLTTSGSTPSRAEIPLPSPASATTTSLAAPTAASSALVIDTTTGRTLYAKNDDTALPMASLTKLMTALLILKGHALTDVVTIDGAVEKLDGDSQKLGFVTGDKLTVRQALDALLVYSANDMAVSLAVWDAGSEAQFVAKMNAMAELLDLKDTHFANASGLDAVNHVSSARDLSKLSQIVLQSSIVREVVRQKSATITTQLGKTYTFASTNQLLANPAVKGLKTGYTAAAGQCLIAYAERDGHAILTVVLGSPDRFAESGQLVKTSLGL